MLAYQEGHRQALFQFEVSVRFHDAANLARGGDSGRREKGVKGGQLNLSRLRGGIAFSAGLVGWLWTERLDTIRAQPVVVRLQDRFPQPPLVFRREKVYQVQPFVLFTTVNQSRDRKKQNPTGAVFVRPVWRLETSWPAHWCITNNVETCTTTVGMHVYTR